LLLDSPFHPETAARVEAQQRVKVLTREKKVLASAKDKEMELRTNEAIQHKEDITKLKGKLATERRKCNEEKQAKHRAELQRDEVQMQLHGSTRVTRSESATPQQAARHFEAQQKQNVAATKLAAKVIGNFEAQLSKKNEQLGRARKRARECESKVMLNLVLFTIYAPCMAKYAYKSDRAVTFFFTLVPTGMACICVFLCALH
jgi:hypothetical protein